VTRRVDPYPEDVAVLRVRNDGTPEGGIERFVAAIEGAASRFRLARVPLDTGRRHVAVILGSTAQRVFRLRPDCWCREC
jgi:thymidine phosphorylase